MQEWKFSVLIKLVSPCKVSINEWSRCLLKVLLTGTLTKNELTVKDAVAYVGKIEDVIFDAALSARPENGDAIDIGICNSHSSMNQ